MIASVGNGHAVESERLLLPFCGLRRRFKRDKEGRALEGGEAAGSDQAPLQWRVECRWRDHPGPSCGALHGELRVGGTGLAPCRPTAERQGQRPRQRGPRPLPSVVAFLDAPPCLLPATNPTCRRPSPRPPGGRAIMARVAPPHRAPGPPRLTQIPRPSLDCTPRRPELNKSSRGVASRSPL